MSETLTHYVTCPCCATPIVVQAQAAVVLTMRVATTSEMLSGLSFTPASAPATPTAPEGAKKEP